jgi:zinc transport system substrate-binding protein
MHWEPEEMPPDAEWAKLADLLKAHAADWMIWEDEPSPEISARLLKGHGVGSAVFRPCGNRPEKGDYLSVMRENLENLEPVFRRE